MKRQNIVGPQIRKLRYNRGWSQAQLAVELALEGLDVQREFVAQIEGQTHTVKDKDLPYFASALKVPVTDLFPKLNAARSIHETISTLLEDRRNGHALPIVMKPLQLVGSIGGK